MPFERLVKGVFSKSNANQKSSWYPILSYDSSKGHHPKNYFYQLLKYLKITNIVLQSLSKAHISELQNFYFSNFLLGIYKWV